MQAFDYVAATTVDEAVSLLVGRDGQVCLLAGGTDLLVQLREGRRQSSFVIDVKRIPELAAIRFDPGQGLVIGAAASCAQLCADPAVAEHYPGLVDAVGSSAGSRSRSRATRRRQPVQRLAGRGYHPGSDRPRGHLQHCRTQWRRGRSRWSSSAPRPAARPWSTASCSSRCAPAATAAGSGARYLRFIPRNEMDIAVVGAGAAVSLDERRRPSSPRHGSPWPPLPRRRCSSQRPATPGRASGLS